MGEKQGQGIVLHHLVVSCRAFGRGVETAVLKSLIEGSETLQWIEGPFQKTDKNEPTLRFLKGFVTDPAKTPWRISREVLLKAGKELLEQTQMRIHVPHGALS